MSVYYTKLKSTCEELNNFRPVCSCGHCTCGGVRNLAAFVQAEYVMSFLMGLNDSFSHIRGQLLLLDPLPPINKVFSLVAQEDRQRNVTSHINSSKVNSANGLAFAFRNDSENAKRTTNADAQISGYNRNLRKDKPFCTHCNFSGHTIDRCYKLHGYPPGYKPKSRAPTMPVANTSIKQISDQTDAKKDSEDGSVGSFVKTLNTSQYQQLMSMLSAHLVSTKVDDSSENPSATGTCFTVSMHPVLMHKWIVDTGATKHICYNTNLFVSMRPLWNSMVTLPNNQIIAVSFCGDIQLSPKLLLKDVLFVPQFHFNLISISALTTDCKLTVHFFS